MNYKVGLGIRISISGFAGNGKTTIISRLKKKFPSSIVMEEVARDMILFFEGIDHFYFQKAILGAEIYRLRLVSKEPNVGFIFDRNIIDALCFSIMRDVMTYETALRMLESNQKILNALYTFDMFLMNPIPEEKIEIVMKDEVRKKTLDNFQKMQEDFYALFEKIVDYFSFPLKRIPNIWQENSQNIVDKIVMQIC